MNCCHPNAGIFVFGSNEAGKHGAGAAHHALKCHGAVYNQGIGLQGNSWGIPTKDSNLKTLDLSTINRYVRDFIEFAKSNPDKKFFVTRIGCGLAGYQDCDIARMFNRAPDNCYLPSGWRARCLIVCSKCMKDDLFLVNNSEELCSKCYIAEKPIGRCKQCSKMDLFVNYFSESLCPECYENYM